MISILVPSRKRPDRLKELYNSMCETAASPGNIEFVVYVDDDDNSYENINLYNMRIIQGPQISIAEAWNVCWQNANGDVLGLFGDDVVARTQDWDKTALEAINASDDHIAYVFGYDGSPYGKTFGTHGFIHQNWAQTVGYFVPPYFKANYVDKWLNDVAIALGRHKHIDCMFEHMHQGFGKAPDDETYQIGRQRDAGMEELYNQKQNERAQDVEKLRAFING